MRADFGWELRAVCGWKLRAAFGWELRSSRAMAPKLTAAERALRLRARASALTDKATLERVVDVLKKRRDVLVKVERDLVNDGFLEAATALVRVVEVETAASKTQKKEALMNDSAALLSGSSNTEDFAHVPFDRNHSTYGDLGSRMLEKLLTTLEPQVCSKDNLNRIRDCGQRVIPKQKLLEILEFAVGVKRTDVIPMQLRTYALVSTHIAATYMTNGRRLATLQLPVDWQRAGVYTCTRDGNKVVISSLECPQKQAMVEVPLDKALWVEHNYSACEAVLRQDGGPWTKRLAPLFEADVVTRVVAVHTRRCGRGKSGGRHVARGGVLLVDAKLERSRSPKVHRGPAQKPMEDTVAEAAEVGKSSQLAAEVSFQPPAPLS